MIRTTRDYKLIYAFDRICFPYDDPYPVRDAKWWVARVDGQLAGFAGAKVLLPHRAVYLCRAGVLPAYQRQGLQRKMIQARVRWARKLQGVEFVITDTRPDNPASSNNLIRCGFLTYRPQAPWCVPGAIYWIKKL